MQDKFSSRTAFIMAAVGSAVGLGNIFRFPALCVGYGSAFIVVYILLLFLVGIPLLLSEIALGRKFGGSALDAIGAADRRFSPLGYLCGINSFVIMTYYCVLFSFVLLAAVFSFRLFGKTPDSAAEIIPEYISASGGFPFDTALFLVVAWAAVILCFGSAERLGKISVAGVLFSSAVIFGFALFRGFFFRDSLASFLIFRTEALIEPRFWLDTLGQVFFSLSVMVGVLITYGACLDKKENLLSSGVVIALFDLGVSLASTVIYATVNADGADGLLASFSVYPKAFAELGALGACLCFLFYLSVGILCLDSIFSYLKSVAGVFYSSLKGSEQAWAVGISLLSALLGFLLLSDAGISFVGVLDGEITPLLILFTGLFETVLFARLVNKNVLLAEINKGAKRGLSASFYRFSVCVLAPLLLVFLILAQIFL